MCWPRSRRTERASSSGSAPETRLSAGPDAARTEDVRLNRKIDIVPYDPVWPEAFALEAEALREVFGSAARSIHHIGSTSVPGLPAKPVIDILIVIAGTSEVGRCDRDMEDLGYRVRGECLDAGGTAGRFYYNKPAVGPRTHHVHVCAEGHFQIPEFLLFAQYLRERTEVADEYARLKRSGLGSGGEDNDEYMAHKHPWVRATIRDALSWYGAPDLRAAGEA